MDNPLPGLILVLGFHKVLSLGPLLFLIYINDLPENLISESKLFADDTSIFSTVFDIKKIE